MLESKFQTKLIDLFKKHYPGCYVRRGSGDNYYAVGGHPDLSILTKGISIYIECKVQPNKATELQKKTLRTIASNGGKAFIAILMKNKSVKITSPGGKEVMTLDYMQGGWQIWRLMRA